MDLELRQSIGLLGVSCNATPPHPTPFQEIVLLFQHALLWPRVFVSNDNYRPRKRRGPLVRKGTAAFTWYILSNTEVETDKSMPKLKMQDFVFKCVIVLD